MEEIWEGMRERMKKGRNDVGMREEGEGDNKREREGMWKGRNDGGMRERE